uniref:Translation initiation factor IF-2, chloroplastic n=1 Tax=Vertebrata lanosa TaxID=1261582 RepID=A0A0B5VUU6_9FLOR|nr:translation initiation factor IF-2 [Vertebrata lanosa]AJH65963.1 translation initiation factor IF-2 [Vertebrata lanosa]
MVSMDYEQYSIFQNSFNSIYFLFNLEYYDDILFLTSPKILSTNVNNFNFLVDGKDIISVNDKNRNINSVKFDRKYGPSGNIDDKDSTKSKKNKSKLNKTKNRNNDNEAKKFTTTSDDLLTIDADSRSKLKLRKTSLRNKKNRSINENIADDTIFRSIVKEDVDQNSIYISESSKNLFIDNPLSIKDFSLKINISEAEIITYLFLNKGISATINEILDFNMCIDLAEHYGFHLLKSKSTKTSSLVTPSEYKTSAFIVEKSPFITILGHVDHGKTTLLDSILKTNLVNEEKGGITQSISAHEIFYQYKSREFKLVFLDTPGHKSFKSMRSRGAKITDLVLLVIGIDDGLQPQTVESINYIKEMNLNCIIVFTKSDKFTNNVQKIKKDLATYHLICDDWGGHIDCIEVSAINNYNIDKLLSKICLMAEKQKLFANPEEPASGVVMDAFLDKKQGSTATLVIQNGTLRTGDIIVSENLLGRVKSIRNFSGIRLDLVGPSSVVKVLCFSSAPKSGSTFLVFRDEKEAKKHSNNYLNLEKNTLFLNPLNKRISSTNSSNQKQLKLIIKADTQGSLEAIMDLLANISQEKVQINIISASFGNISNGDTHLSVTTKSSIIAFNVNALPQINSLIKKYKINFKIFYVIYDLLDCVQNLMLDLVDPEYSMRLTGSASVQTIFKMNKGFVAGCIVSSGKINSKSYIYVYRKNIMIYKNYITSLKYLKSDVKEVIAPSECGLMSDFQEWQESDLIEAYDVFIKEKEL